jgi:putative sterol carrier protein
MRNFFERQFNSEKSKGLDACIRIEWNNGHIVFLIRDEQIKFIQDDNPELIIYFIQKTDVLSLFRGESDPFDAFTQGKLRANGHLIWIFQTIFALSG